MVLHYESVAYERWTTKFSELAARHGHDDAILEKLPFPFYRSSLSAVGEGVEFVHLIGKVLCCS